MKSSKVCAAALALNHKEMLVLHCTVQDKTHATHTATKVCLAPN